MKHIYAALILATLTPTSWALEAYQGSDVQVESWRCGAPLVEALRQEDNDNLLNDSAGKLKLKESLETISQNNLDYQNRQLGKLSADEQALMAKIQTTMPAPIVHRTDVVSSQIILTNGKGMVSASKRNAAAKITPNIEQQLFSGRDCLFATVAPPYGTSSYGPVILRFKNKRNFAWGSIYTGWTWTQEVAKRAVTDPATDWMKRKFARQIYTNNHWGEAIALQVIGYIREGSSVRGKGAPYDKNKILSELLKISSADDFWKKIVNHRLAYLEAHYTDDIPVSDLSFVQYRVADAAAVAAMGLPAAWTTKGANSFIQFFNRTE